MRMIRLEFGCLGFLVLSSSDEVCVQQNDGPLGTCPFSLLADILNNKTIGNK
jgi:hypothetical protein